MRELEFGEVLRLTPSFDRIRVLERAGKLQHKSLVKHLPGIHQQEAMGMAQASVSPRVGTLELQKEKEVE